MNLNQLTMRYLFVIIITSLFFFPGFVFGQIKSAENGLTRDSQGLLAEEINFIYEKAQAFPNGTQLSLAFIEGGEVKFAGIRRQNDSLVWIANQQQVFEIGSISKVFTSTLLAKLVLNGTVNLNDSVGRYLDSIAAAGQGITFKQLSNHTSGLPRLPSNLNLQLVDPENPYKNYDVSKLKNCLREDLVLNNVPGKVYEYSNLGAGLLGFVLTTVSGRSYEEMLRQFIFSKYGMNQSTTVRSKVENRLVKGLDASGHEVSNWDLNVLVGAGGILSSAEDLSKFAVAQFNPKNKELALTQLPTFTINNKMKIGMGWHLPVKENGDLLLWHNGGTGGYTSSMVLDKKMRRGVIILSNVSAFSPETGKIDELSFGLIKFR